MKYVLGIVVMILFGVTPVSVQAVTPRDLAINCFTEVVGKHGPKGEAYVRSYITGQVDLESLSIIVSIRGKISIAEARTRVANTISGNQSSAFRDMNYTTVVFDRQAKVIKGPKRTETFDDPLVWVSGYYYRNWDTNRTDRELFEVILRVSKGACQIIDIAWNNAWLSWAAVNGL